MEFANKEDYQTITLVRASPACTEELLVMFSCRGKGLVWRDVARRDVVLHYVAWFSVMWRSVTRGVVWRA